jgi:hypothetical protein
MLSPISDMMIDTMAPFADLAIEGMFFRGRADCAAAPRAARSPHRITTQNATVLPLVLLTPGSPKLLKV